jgi:hypothetical protein
MCNLYSLTRSADEMRRVFLAHRDSTGNLPRCPASFPTSSRQWFAQIGRAHGS